MTEQQVSTQVRQLREKELDEADSICRSAFNTFVGVPDLFGDQDYVHTRWRAAPHLAVAAELEGQLVGSNFITCWGSFGFFGPLSVRPELWDRGLAKGLMEVTMDILGNSNLTHAGLFTFGQSPKHVGLYQRFGFWPRFLTPIVGRPVGIEEVSERADWSLLSELDETGRSDAIAECRDVTNELYPGLDLQREIEAVLEQGLGDVVLLEDDRLRGFAVCHVGPGTEAGGGSGYIKFAALRPGSTVGEFDRLLDACEALTARRGASVVQFGVNTSHQEAYRRVVERGYRAGLIGVAMQKPNAAAWNREGLFVIDDWR